MQFQVPEAMNQVGCHEDSSHARALLSLRFAYGIRYHNLISTMQEAERQLRETTGGVEKKGERCTLIRVLHENKGRPTIRMHEIHS